MGSIQRRPDGRWRARYRDPSGRERAKHFTRKVEAERFLTSVEASKLRGAYVDPNDRTTVAEYARRWAAGRPHRATTARRIDAQIRNHIEGTALGGRRLAAVLPSDVQAWVTDRSRILAPSSLRQQVTMLRAIFSAAAGDRLIGSSPFVRISVPRAEAERVVPLTVDQVRALAGAVPGDGAHASGARSAPGRAARAARSRRRLPAPHGACGAPARRAHPGAGRAQDAALAAHDPPTGVRRRGARRAHARQWRPLEDGTLFYGERSRRPYDHAHYATRIYGRAVGRLAAAEGSTFPRGITTHDLRHHYASVLLAGGESVVAVADRLGHEDAAMVLRVYGHLMPDSEDRTRKVVDAAWSTGGPGVLRVAAGGAGADSTRTEEVP